MRSHTYVRKHVVNADNISAVISNTVVVLVLVIAAVVITVVINPEKERALYKAKICKQELPRTGKTKNYSNRAGIANCTERDSVNEENLVLCKIYLFTLSEISRTSYPNDI